jgi:ribosomal protein S18 acetylase RimI-like enzyme
MIVAVTSTNELPQCALVIQKAFTTVADNFELNQSNCPTHPSFIIERKLLEYYEKGISMFRFVDANKTVGFVAIEQPDENQAKWYIEKLSVIPEFRKKGIGKKLMDHAITEIKKRGGSEISIALIDEQTLLKEWYAKMGFNHVLTKNFSHLPFNVCFMEMKL